MIRQSILPVLFFVLCAFSPLLSAGAFKPGYLLTTQSDTVFGLVEEMKYPKNALSCQFKSSDNAEVKGYAPKSIYGYGYKGGRSYVSKNVKVNEDTNFFFVEYLFLGKLSFFFLQDLGGVNHYYVSKGGDSLVELVYSEKIIMVEGRKVKKVHKGYLGVLLYYTFDCKEANEYVKTMGVPNHKKLIKLGRVYRMTCVDDLIDNHVEKVMPRAWTVKANFEKIWFNNATTASNGIHAFSADFLRREVSLSENIYFGAGVRYMFKTNEDGGVLEFPVSINYFKRSKGLSPIVGYKYMFGKFLNQSLYAGAQYRNGRASIMLFADVKTFNFFEYLGSAVGVGVLFDL